MRERGGEMSATGFSPSNTSTSSPAFTQSSTAPKLRVISLTVAVFMTSECIASLVRPPAGPSGRQGGSGHAITTVILCARPG